MHKQDWSEVGGLLDVWLLFVGSCQTVVYTSLETRVDASATKSACIVWNIHVQRSAMLSKIQR
jgi:hypothetical protein